MDCSVPFRNIVVGALAFMSIAGAGFAKDPLAACETEFAALDAAASAADARPVGWVYKEEIRLSRAAKIVAAVASVTGGNVDFDPAWNRLMTALFTGDWFKNWSEPGFQRPSDAAAIDHLDKIATFHRCFEAALIKDDPGYERGAFQNAIDLHTAFAQETFDIQLDFGDAQ